MTIAYRPLKAGFGCAQGGQHEPIASIHDIGYPRRDGPLSLARGSAGRGAVAGIDCSLRAGLVMWIYGALRIVDGGGVDSWIQEREVVMIAQCPVSEERPPVPESMSRHYQNGGLDANGYVRAGYTPPPPPPMPKPKKCAYCGRPVERCGYGASK